MTHPPAEPPPLVAGVARPRSLELSGRVADGTLIAEGHGDWLGRPQEEVFTVSGSASEAAEDIGALSAAGADTVVLRIVGAEPLRQLDSVLRALGR